MMYINTMKRQADYNSEDEFITMLPKDIRALAAETITHIKDENNDFDINNPYDVEQLIDDLCTCHGGIINMMRGYVNLVKELCP